MRYHLILSLLMADADWRDPNPERSKVTAIDHALQTASRALRAGAKEQEIVIALLHDAARPLTDVYHGEAIAWILADRIEEKYFQALMHHGEFQADIIHGTTIAEQYRERFWYPAAKRLASWDSLSFNPDYLSYPLSQFLPALRKVLGE